MKIGILLFIILIATYTDIKKRIIPNNLIVFGLATGIYFSVAESQKLYILMSFILIVIFMVFGNGLGYGDQKLLSLIPMFLQDKSSLFFVYLTVIYLLYYFYQKRKKIHKLPFAPGILAATILSILTEVL